MCICPLDGIGFPEKSNVFFTAEARETTRTMQNLPRQWLASQKIGLDHNSAKCCQCYWLSAGETLA